MEEIKGFIIDEIEKIAFRKVGDSDSLIQTRILDSIALVDLLVAIEEKLGITIPNAEINADHFDTINKMMEYLSKKMKHGQA